MQIHLCRADMPTYYHKGCRACQGGVHAIECNGDKTAFQWKILDQCSNQIKLMVDDTREALYKKIETSHQHAGRIQNTRIDTESLVWT